MSIRSGHRKGPWGGSVVVCSRSVSGTSGPNVRRVVFAVQRVGSRPGGGGAGVPASNTGAVLAAKPSGRAGSEVSATFASAASGGGHEHNRRPRSNRPRHNHWRARSGQPGAANRFGENHLGGRRAGAAGQVRGPAPAFCGQKYCLHSCARPGCYVLFVVSQRSPCQKFCSVLCRQALRRVLDREKKWQRRRDERLRRRWQSPRSPPESSL